MHIGTLFLTAAASAVLAGCFTVEVRPQYIVGVSQYTIKTKDCTGDCSVDVEVEAYAGGMRCRIKPVDAIQLRGGQGNRNVEWTLVTAGYEFSTDLLRPPFFVKSPPPPDNIKDIKVTGAGKKLTLKWEHRGQGLAHEYGLNVRSTSGLVCDPLDPWLIS